MERLEPLSYKERLRELGLGDLFNDRKDLKRGVQKMSQDLSGRAQWQGSGYRLTHRRFYQNIKNHNLLWRWSSTGAGCPEKLWRLHAWRYSKVIWSWWLFLSSGVGQEDSGGLFSPQAWVLWSRRCCLWRALLQGEMDGNRDSGEEQCPLWAPKCASQADSSDPGDQTLLWWTSHWSKGSLTPSLQQHKCGHAP